MSDTILKQFDWIFISKERMKFTILKFKTPTLIIYPNEADIIRIYLTSIHQKKGKHEYNELCHSYVIFICTFDYYQKDYYKYTFTYKCDEIEGLAKGENRFTELMTILYELNRDDAKKTAADKEYRKILFKEFHLQDKWRINKNERILITGFPENPFVFYFFIPSPALVSDLHSRCPSFSLLLQDYLRPSMVHQRLQTYRK